MKKAGCIKCDIGIESGSPRILEYLRKNISLEEVKRGVKILNREGILWSGFFMIGIPEEKQEDIILTLEFMKNIRPPEIYGSIYTPLPGTQIFKDLVESKIIDENNHDFEKYSSYSEDNYFMKHISRDEFNSFKKQFFKFIDSNNNSQKALLNRIIKRWKFWVYNPNIFINKTFQYTAKHVPILKRYNYEN